MVWFFSKYVSLIFIFKKEIDSQKWVKKESRREKYFGNLENLFPKAVQHLQLVSISIRNAEQYLHNSSRLRRGVARQGVCDAHFKSWLIHAL